MFPLEASGVRSRGRNVISRGNGRAKFRNGPVVGRPGVDYCFGGRHLGLQTRR